MVPMTDDDSKIERKHIREFQNFLINKGAKLASGADGVFDLETFIVAVKLYDRLSAQRGDIRT